MMCYSQNMQSNGATQHHDVCSLPAAALFFCLMDHQYHVGLTHYFSIGLDDEDCGQSKAIALINQARVVDQPQLECVH